MGAKLRHVPTRIPRLALLVAALCTAVGATAATSDAATTTAPRATWSIALKASSLRLRHDPLVSSNWAGYVVGDETGSTSFTRVAARWVQPATTCTSSERSFSAFWVGLGGFDDTSQALEQIGTEADCSPGGDATYAMWYELVPAPSVRIKLKVFPGNVLAAYVSVSGTKVTLQIKNLSRKTTFKRTLRMASPDVSSAEWIAEAPSACASNGRCFQLPLSNFGSLSFTRASVTGNGHTGTIIDASWTNTMVKLVSQPDVPFVDQSSPTGALPSELSPDGTAFRIDWQAAIS
jgi:hypothetical protein